MLVVKSKIAEIVKNNGKRMSKEAWTALDARVRVIIEGAIKSTGSFKTIKDTEVLMSGRNGEK
jgi:hypothetical protein